LSNNSQIDPNLPTKLYPDLLDTVPEIFYSHVMKPLELPQNDYDAYFSSIELDDGMKELYFRLEAIYQELLDLGYVYCDDTIHVHLLLNGAKNWSISPKESYSCLAHMNRALKARFSYKELLDGEVWLDYYPLGRIRYNCVCIFPDAYMYDRRSKIDEAMVSILSSLGRSDEDEFSTTSKQQQLIAIPPVMSYTECGNFMDYELTSIAFRFLELRGMIRIDDDIVTSLSYFDRSSLTWKVE
jgi:hypothetical protein